MASSCGLPAQDAGSPGTLTGTWVLDLTQYKQEYADFEYMEQSSNCMLYTLSLYIMITLM